MGTGSFTGIKYGRGVLLTTYSLLEPRSWKSRALPTLWATTEPVTGSLYLTNDNNAVITNYYGWLQDLTLLFKIPMSTRKGYFNFIDNLGTRPQKRFASDVLSKTYPSAVLCVSQILYGLLGTEPGTHSKSNAHSEIGEHQTESFQSVLTHLHNIIPFVQLSEIVENVRSNAITNV